MTDYTAMSDDELRALVGGAAPAAAPVNPERPAVRDAAPVKDYSTMSDADLGALIGQPQRIGSPAEVAEDAKWDYKKGPIKAPVSFGRMGEDAATFGKDAMRMGGEMVDLGTKAYEGVKGAIANPEQGLKDANRLAIGVAQKLHPLAIGKQVVTDALRFMNDPKGNIKKGAEFVAEHPAETLANASLIPGVGGAVGGTVKAVAGAPIRAADTVLRHTAGHVLSGLTPEQQLLAYSTGRAAPSTGRGAAFREQLFAKDGDLTAKAKPVMEGRAAAREMADTNSATYLANKDNWIPDGNGGFIPPTQAPVDMTGVRRAMVDAEARSRPHGNRFPDAADAVDTVNKEVRGRLATQGPEISPAGTIPNPASPFNPIDPKTGLPQNPTMAVAAVHGPGPANFVEGADQMKQAVGHLMYKADVAKQGTKARAMTTPVHNAIKEAIVAAAPNYAKAMEGSQNALVTLQEIRKGMSLGDKASIDTALSKLQSATRGDVSSRYGFRRALLEQLADYRPLLPDRLAGQAANSWMPRGPTGKIVSSIAAAGAGAGGLLALPASALAALAIAPVASPKLGAIIRHGAGIGVRHASNAADAAANAANISRALSSYTDKDE